MAVIDLKPKSVVVETKGSNDKYEEEQERPVLKIYNPNLGNGVCLNKKRAAFSSRPHRSDQWVLAKDLLPCRCVGDMVKQFAKAQRRSTRGWELLQAL